MFVILSKLLPQFVYPLGLITILIVITLILLHIPKLTSKNNWAKRSLMATLLLILLTSNSYTASSLVRSLEWSYIPPEQISQVPVIVILGGGTDAPQFPRSGVEINGAGDRVLVGARLYHEGIAPKILLSGGAIEWLDNRESSTAASEMKQILDMLDVPDEAIWIQDISRNTYEDALYSSKILKERSIKRILLVTSAMHMPRAAALFKHQGLEVIPYPTDYSITEAKWTGLFDSNLATSIINFFPSISNMGMTTSALREYIGCLVYRLRGWM